MADAPSTLFLERDGAFLRVPRYRLRVVSGPDAGAEVGSEHGRLTLGTAEDVMFRLTDPTVSRYHAELEATTQGIVLTDLGSTNGTYVGTAQVREVVLRAATELTVGRTRMLLVLDVERSVIPTSSEARFGDLLGGSAPMRAVYTALERAAPTVAPVLVTGESGTGKELAARAIHLASGRSGGPFEVIDCGGLPATLIEAELFGHDRGAFTGATGERKGALERADGGTVFLDELGELPLELQPKLLRVLGEREVRRLGGSKARRIDVRVVAATNRDLRRLVNTGQFRADLYYRLAVVTIQMPPLRARLDDLPMLVPALLRSIAEEHGLEAPLECSDELLATLSTHSWPGNVRELRNHLAQLCILRAAAPFHTGDDDDEEAASFDPALFRMPLRAAKAALVERFERDYIRTILAATKGKISEAAKRAGVDRGTLFRTLRRHQRGEGPASEPPPSADEPDKAGSR